MQVASLRSSLPATLRPVKRADAQQTANKVSSLNEPSHACGGRCDDIHRRIEYYQGRRRAKGIRVDRWVSETCPACVS